MNTNVQQGDWLIPYNCEEPHRIREISYQEEPAGKWTIITFEGEGFWGVWNYPAYCKPIPISEEILAKNFEKKTHWGIFEDYFDFTIREFNDGMYVVNYDCCEMNLPGTQIVGICWVHELQQVLRLLGIKKEIEL